MADLGPKGARARGRELALLTLCHLESYGAAERTAGIDVLWSSPPDSRDLHALLDDAHATAFARHLLELLEPNLAELDGLIEDTSARWRLERMDQVDRNLVRLAAAELAHEPDTPRAVVLAEAVRLAERYGGERSASFVNGLCEALAARLRPEPAREGGARG